MLSRRTSVALLLAACIGSPTPMCAAEPLTRIRMTIDETPIIPQLAASLGYLAEQGLEIIPVDINTLSTHDFLLQQPLIDGRIDATYHWFHHAVFGARHNVPIQAVMLFNDAPGMTVFVANRVR